MLVISYSSVEFFATGGKRPGKRFASGREILAQARLRRTLCVGYDQLGEHERKMFPALGVLAKTSFPVTRSPDVSDVRSIGVKRESAGQAHCIEFATAGEG